VHRDDNDTTVEEIESAFYADPVEQDTVELNLVEKAKKALVGLSDLEAFQVVMEKVGIGFVRNTNFDDPIWTLNVVDFELEELGKIYISFDENGKLWYAIKDLC
jgi:hypothetical protein